jgi:hypothetical protein
VKLVTGILFVVLMGVKFGCHTEGEIAFLMRVFVGEMLRKITEHEGRERERETEREREN